MAEINIERKERSALPWLLAGLLVLALAWFLFARGTIGTVASDVRPDSVYRDTSAAAGTLAPAADTRLPDTSSAIPPR